MKPLKKILNQVKHTMERNLHSSAHQVMEMGLIICIGFPFLYWVWSVWFPQPYENLWLRLLGSLLGLGLVLSSYWPLTLKRHLPWYWFFTLLYALPFFFAYSFLMNQASVISAMSLLCSAFILVLLVDRLTLSILLVLGWGLAFLCYYLSAAHLYFGEAHMEMGLVILFVVVAGSTINYKTAMLQQQRLAGVAATASMIAHELRTPLLSIKSGAQGLVGHLPLLIHAYQLAIEHNHLQNPIRKNRLQNLGGVCDRMISEINYANTIIDMLLIKAGRENSLENCVLEPCSMATCLSEAIARYPFQTVESRALIKWDGDFEFVGSKLLMQHVLFNLLKNALYAISTAKRGEISIWTKSDADFHYLFVKDTAKGMTPRQLSRLFEHFYTTKFMGTGIGLSFCKLVMQRFDGDITCEAKEGIYTQFTLAFPNLQLSEINQAVSSENSFQP